LLVDEADILVDKGMIEVVRDIYESNQASIILIGEENLPASLKRWERVHGRMLDWVAAQPASLSDAKHLAKLYCKGVEISDELMEALHKKAGGSVRRVCVNLDRLREQAQTRRLQHIGVSEFDPAGFFTGDAPAPRGRL
jgi:hypothetical protein